MIRLAVLAYTLLCSFAVEAGSATADISMDVSIVPSNPVTPGTEGTISISITNLGPDAAPFVLFQWFQTETGMGTEYPPLEFLALESGPCGISPIIQPGPDDTFGVWTTNNVGPGESRTCNFGFRVSETTVVRQRARWESFVFNANDPNQSNNEAELLLVFAEMPDPEPIPALSGRGLIMLALLLGLIALFTRVGRSARATSRP